MARRDETYILYTFESPHSAIKAQKVLESLKPKVIPVLRELSESCGMAVKISVDDMEKSLELMEESRVSKWSMYRVEIVNGELFLEQLKEK